MLTCDRESVSPASLAQLRARWRQAAHTSTVVERSSAKTAHGASYLVLAHVQAGSGFRWRHFLSFCDWPSPRCDIPWRSDKDAQEGLQSVWVRVRIRTLVLLL